MFGWDDALGLAGGLIGGGLFGGGGRSNYAQMLLDLRRQISDLGVANYNEVDSNIDKAIGSVKDSYKILGEQAADNVNAAWDAKGYGGGYDSKLAFNVAGATLPLQQQLAQITSGLYASRSTLKEQALAGAEGALAGSDALALNVDQTANNRSGNLLNSILDVVGRFKEGAKNGGGPSADPRDSGGFAGLGDIMDQITGSKLAGNLGSYFQGVGLAH